MMKASPLSRTAVGAVSAALVAVLAGCGTGGGGSAATAGCETTTTIGYSHPVSEAKAVQAVARYVKERAAEVGCVEVLLDATTNLNLETQRAAVENWITQGVDAIVIRPVDPTAFQALQREAQGKGIKWLTYTKPMAGEDGAVGWDTDKAGELIAQDVAAWVAKNRPQGPITAAVTELSTESSLAGQWELPTAALEKAGVKVVLAQDCADQECGLAMAENALAENPDLRVFIAGSTDDPGVGAARAFQNAGIDPSTVYIGGMDGSEQALDAIKQGTYFKSTAAIRLDLLGFSIVDAALNAVKGSGETRIVSPNQLAKADDMTALDGLIDQYR